MRDIVVICDLYDEDLKPCFDRQVEIYNRLVGGFNVFILPYLAGDKIYYYDSTSSLRGVSSANDVAIQSKQASFDKLKIVDDSANKNKAYFTLPESMDRDAALAMTSPLEKINKELNNPIIYPRITGQKVRQGLEIYKNLEGIKLEDEEVLKVATSKILTNKAFVRAGVFIPKTVFSDEIDDVAPYFRTHPVIKLDYGYRGKGVFMPSSLDEYINLCEGEDFILQERVESESVYSIRVNIVGGEICSAYKVNGLAGRNVSNSGRAEIYKLNDEDRELALAAWRAVPLKIAGVDIIKDIEGNSYVLEVNTTPSLELGYGISEEEGNKFASTIADYILRSF